MYNRFYLDPHITPELAGTELKYNFRNDRLTINLDSNSYAVSNKKFKIICDRNFGFFNAFALNYTVLMAAFLAALQVNTDNHLTLKINNWNTLKK